jgi:hypothetical protein
LSRHLSRTLPPFLAPLAIETQTLQPKYKLYANKYLIIGCVCS